MREALCTLLHKAGEIMLSAHGSGRVFTKPGDANYVTEYDIRVQRFLREELSRLLPEADFIGEEDEEKHGSESLRWIVDPIDGTTNFMHGLLESSVSAALCEGGDTLLGAVYQPYRDEFFFAEKGKGASLNREAIRVSGHAPEGALFTFGTTPYDRSSAGKTFRLLEAVFDGGQQPRLDGTLTTIVEQHLRAAELLDQLAYFLFCSFSELHIGGSIVLEVFHT